LFRGNAGNIQRALADLGPRAGETRVVTLAHGDRAVFAQMRTCPTVWDGQPAPLVTLTDISRTKENEARIRELEVAVANLGGGDGAVRMESLTACLTATASPAPSSADSIQFSLLSSARREAHLR
jgi:hypothetical protein